MPNYLSVGAVARRLGVSEAAIQEMLDIGWLKAKTKNDIRFLNGHQEYRARFILALRAKKALSNQEIGFVLAEQQPPYDFQEVDSILARMQTPA
jgi:DNA-binding transcriptional MerR regulator